MNLKYIVSLIVIGLLLSGSFSNAYAAAPLWEFPTYTIDNFPAGDPDKVRFNVGDPDPSSATANGTPDEIVTVTVNSFDSVLTLIDTLTFDLTEVGDTGIFGPLDKLVLMIDQDVQFDVTDNVLVTVVDNCDEDDGIGNCDPDTIETLSGAFNDGVYIYSDTTGSGIGKVPIDLVETGPATGTFTRSISFTTTGLSDSSTALLLVSPGDRFTVEDMEDTTTRTGLINGGTNSFGIFVVDSGTVEVTVDGNTDSTLITEAFAPGRGGGGLIRPGLVIDSPGGGGGGESSPPTLGFDTNHKRIVENGFSFNGNAVDVQEFYTPYPLITTQVGKINTVKLKIYDNKGLDNISHVGLSYGLGKGEIFNEGRATIEYDRIFNGIETVSLFDPKHVIGNVNVTTSIVKCSSLSNDMCLEVTFDHMFRESLDYNMMATNIWDYERNGWQNYFNHGIDIVGESMNPPEEYSGIYKGHIYHLTSTGKNIAVDDEGNSWTFDKIWNRDYIKTEKLDRDILNPKKIWAIEHLGNNYSDDEKVFGFDRSDHRFKDNKNQQQILAQNIMSNLCPECLEESYEEINEIFSYDIPSHSKKLEDTKIVNQMNIEDQKARKLLKEFFEKIYPSLIND